MKSRFAHVKDHVIALRKQGVSITAIENQYGVPRSTLSGWFRRVELTDDQRSNLRKNSNGLGTDEGKRKALLWHNGQKQKRIDSAKEDAIKTMQGMRVVDTHVVELALAMLYLGEGSKKGLTSMGNSNEMILNFFIGVLKTVYGVAVKDLKCDLHLRYDQDEDVEKRYWSEKLALPKANFIAVSYDRRTTGKPTRNGYHGVCVVRCGHIAIMRKLVYLSTIFCDHVIRMRGD